MRWLDPSYWNFIWASGFYRRGAAAGVLLALGLAGAGAIAAAPHPDVGRQSCIECHESPHRSSWPRDCRSCHRDAGQPWSKAGEQFSPKQHEKNTGFDLFPPHDSLSCTDCHSPDLAFSVAHSTGILPACVVCHETPHGTQFVGRHNSCLACHDRGPFKTGSYTLADHTRFPLEGAHRAVACHSCHRPDSKTGIRRFAGTPRNCGACHAEPHRGQFAKNGRTDCARCHRAGKPWKRPAFDHDTQAAFQLGSAHRNLACRSCHPVARQPDGAAVTQFRPLAKECQDCHGK